MEHLDGHVEFHVSGEIDFANAEGFGRRLVLCSPQPIVLRLFEAAEVHEDLTID